jgi:primosomal protein N' (replication factor Y)
MPGLFHHCILQIALDTPLNAIFDYRWHCDAAEQPQVGQLALVPFGRREVMGLIVGVVAETDVPVDKLKDALAVRSQLGPLSPEWLALAGFAADYYQRPLGEVALPGLPKNLRVLTTVALDRALKKLAKHDVPHDGTPLNMPVLNPSQQQAADAIGGAQGFKPTLLYGVTGSGKTEVYLQACAQVLAREPDGQILILVPEINLTPQLEGNIRARFPGVMLATLHSSLSEGERMLHWLAAHQGKARIVLGTRLAILASLPNLKLIVIDEEHDPSYKQQEGLRYSARDLAVWRAWQLGIPIVLGSATPSLESWHHAQSGRYRKLELRERAVKNAVLPQVKLLDMERDKPKDGLTSHLIAAIKQRMERGEQSLLFLNRRGYAPVICCESLHLVHGAAPPGAPAALPPLQPGAAHPAPLPDLRQCRPATAGTRHPARGRGLAGHVSGSAGAAHRRRLDPQERQRAGSLRYRAPGRGRYPDRHTDGGQGA